MAARRRQRDIPLPILTTIDAPATVKLAAEQASGAAMRKKGDNDGADTWLRIIVAIGTPGEPPTKGAALAFDYAPRELLRELLGVNAGGEFDQHQGLVGTARRGEFARYPTRIQPTPHLIDARRNIAEFDPDLNRRHRRSLRSST
jgi:hypothetical protein